MISQISFHTIDGIRPFIGVTTPSTTGRGPLCCVCVPLYAPAELLGGCFPAEKYPLENFPKVGDENKTHLKPPPRHT